MTFLPPNLGGLSQEQQFTLAKCKYYAEKMSVEEARKFFVFAMQENLALKSTIKTLMMQLTEGARRQDVTISLEDIYEYAADAAQATIEREKRKFFVRAFQIGALTVEAIGLIAECIHRGVLHL